MKNKPAPALLRPSKLSNEIKKRVPKSRETIPLRRPLVPLHPGPHASQEAGGGNVMLPSDTFFKF
jgi:hypothetical protein